jgi:hypothetical protein
VLALRRARGRFQLFRLDALASGDTPAASIEEFLHSIDTEAHCSVNEDCREALLSVCGVAALNRRRVGSVAAASGGDLRAVRCPPALSNAVVAAPYCRAWLGDPSGRQVLRDHASSNQTPATARGRARLQLKAAR